MADLRKVISPLNVPQYTTGTSKVLPPEGDKYVFYSNSGFLTTDFPPMLGGVSLNVNVNSSDAAKAASNTPILRGTFYSTNNNTLNPSDIDPRRLIIMGAGIGGDCYINFPNPGGAGGLIPYLKQAYGADNITPGLCWTITFINDTGGAANRLILQINAPGAGQGTVFPYNFIVNGAVSTTSILGSASGAAADGYKNSRQVTFIIISTTTGAESMCYIAH